VTDDYEPRDDEIDPQLNEGGKPATEYPEDDPETAPEVPTP